MLGIGVDIGSTATKVAVLDDSGEIVETWMRPTGFSSVDAANGVAEHLEAQGFFEVPHAVVATGYGRVAVPFADKVVTEITCHGKGAARLFGRDGVVIDVGGQDTKVIQLAGGMVKKFLMNDKCAAGTGRFLEIMADRLAVSQAELSELARAGEPTSISSMCTVFAESEVVSLVAQNKDVADIIHGLNVSVASKVGALAARLGKDNPGEYMMTGGVAKNEGIIRALEEKLGAKLYICDEAQLCGALGAALFAGEKCRQQDKEEK